MEFRLCAQNQPLVPTSQACLDRHLLERVEGAGTRFYPGPGNKVDIHSIIIHLIHSFIVPRCLR